MPWRWSRAVLGLIAATLNLHLRIKSFGFNYTCLNYWNKHQLKMLYEGAPSAIDGSTGPGWQQAVLCTTINDVSHAKWGFFLPHLTICLWMMAFHYFKMHLDCIVIKIYSPEGSHFKASPFESVGGVSRRDVVMNPFIFLLTRYRQIIPFISIWEVITSINYVWKAKLVSGRRQCTATSIVINFLIKLCW